MVYSSMPAKWIIKMSASGEIPEYKEEWFKSGITAGNRELHLNDMETLLTSMGEVQLQFDSADWLVKALTAEDIRKAKRDGRVAGIVTAQETDALGTHLELLDVLYNFGLRILQLTYNNQNLLGSGCAEQADGGLSNYGVRFIGRMNQLGIIVDTGHCGKRTTLDACKISSAPVIASHTGAAAIYPHMRCKSDDELMAIANTGGVIGIFAMPWFVHEDPNDTTLDHVLDHIDYVVRLVGADHVGIGTDWPMSDLDWSLIYFKEQIAPKLGFAKGDGPSTETVKGLEKYSYFINFTRGLVARGYSDEDIAKIMGGNWLRVFEQICG
ncbi:Membrane dipeptidase [compost metagenome]